MKDSPTRTGAKCKVCGATEGERVFRFKGKPAWTRDWAEIREHWEEIEATSTMIYLDSNNLCRRCRVKSE